MTTANRQLIEDFFQGIADGELPSRLVTDDMSAWTLTSGEISRDRFALGIKLLARIFGGTLSYHIESMTAEDNRVVVEARSEGTLASGEAFRNLHVFIFTLRDGKIALVKEYMDPIIVAEKLAPLLREAATAGGD